MFEIAFRNFSGLKSTPDQDYPDRRWQYFLMHLRCLMNAPGRYLWRDFCCFAVISEGHYNARTNSNVPLTQPQHHWVILLKLSKAFLPSVTQDWLSLSFPPNRRRPDVGQACRISSPVVLRQVSGGGLREGHHAHGGNPGLGVRRPLSEQTTPDSKLKCSQPKQGPVIRCLFQTLWLGSTCHVT